MNAADEPFKRRGGTADALLAPLLPADAAPWVLATDLWAPADAQRWRQVLARGASNQLAVLGEAPPPPLLWARLEQLAGAPIEAWRCGREGLDALLSASAAGWRALEAVHESADDFGTAEDAMELSAAAVAGQTSPAVRLLDATLFDALHDGASDVHLEAEARGLRIRFRLDGVLQPVRRSEGVELAEQLVSRLKVMAGLDIGERRLPQDGRFRLRLDGREIDCRLSVMPSAHGEDAVVRLLDRRRIEQDHGRLDLAALGFDAAEREALLRLGRLPHGMLLVTGPTGSGKTTTLYAIVTAIDNGREKIVTIEDPVEYQLPGVVQIPVNERKGLSFARGLRSVLRHDPDRVMVGEIRDGETAQIAVQAALTGHLVFSSVHANGAFDVIARFLHMGLDARNVTSALNAVLAQRLLRLNCPQCSVAVGPVPAPAGPAADSNPHGATWRSNPHGATWRQGQGCAHCRGSGYRGRRAVSELLVLDDTLRGLIVDGAPAARLREAARERGMRSLRDAALAAVDAGLTTREEADRVTLDG